MIKHRPWRLLEVVVELFTIGGLKGVGVQEWQMDLVPLIVKASGGQLDDMNVDTSDEACPHWLIPLVSPFASFSSFRSVNDKLENATQPEIWVKHPAPDMTDVMPKVIDPFWAFKIKPRWLTIGNALRILRVVRVDAVVGSLFQYILNVRRAGGVISRFKRGRGIDVAAADSEANFKIAEGR